MLYQLLGDSTRTLQAITEKVVYECTQHGRQINTMMFAELLVLLEQDGLTDNVRNVLEAKNDDFCILLPILYWWGRHCRVKFPFVLWKVSYIHTVSRNTVHGQVCDECFSVFVFY